ncbi:MAG: FtsX-like permease family protein [Haloferacaceae archaeon]
MRRRALVAFALGRAWRGLRGPRAKRLGLAVGGVAVAVALLTTVSGVALGLASQSVVQADGVDYWVVPEGDDLTTVAVATDGPRLGDTHALAADLRTDPRVTHATPVFLQVTPVRTAPGAEPTYVLLVGVVAPGPSATADAPRVAGLPTAPLSPGDPHYANGTYDGRWTGELVASPAAAELLDVGAGDDVVVGSTAANRTFRVTAVASEGPTTAAGATPVALVHLSELQSVAGAAGGDTADQLLVATNDPGVRSDLDEVYPRTTVVTRGGLSGGELSTTSLPAAMALAAFLVSLAVGALFTATTMGLEVTRDRRTLATLAALGYRDRSLVVLVATETLALCLLGGVAGVALGAVGVAATNAAVAQVGLPRVATFHPALVPLGVGTAALIGLVAAPYPVWLSRRTAVSEVLG